MNRFYVIFLTALMAVSCFSDEEYAKYRLNANFEYGSLVDFRPDSTYFISEGIGFPYDCLVFGYKVNDVGDFTGGFRLSCVEGIIKNNDYAMTGRNDADGNPLNLTWRVYSKPEKNTYLVYYGSSDMPDYEFAPMTVANGTLTCTLVDCVVNNTSKVADEVMNKFERGDKMTLTATGYLAGKETGKASINLADYTQNDEAGMPKDSIVSTWTTLDLSTLGEVDQVKFKLEATKDIPRYFCLDAFRADISITY